MPNYTRLAATAERLIEGAGRSITFYKRTTTPADPAKPWRGPADSTEDEGETTVATVIGVYVTPSDSELGQLMEALNLVKRRGSRFLVAALSTTEDLTTYQYIKDGTQIYAIEKADLLKPGGVALLYDFEVKK